MAHSPMQQAIDEYLMMLQVESGCAANTLAAYRRDLRKLVDFFQQEAIPDVSALTKPLWGKFLGSLQASGLSASSIARCLAAVRGFYKHVAAGRG
ncbi:MAG: site-specific integrase, partial [Nitrospirota bacterium]|nr:site-specific integrase [Nitrospirota bacterium]